MPVLSLEQIRMIGRNTQGVKIMNLEGRQKVASMTIIPHAEEIEDEELEEAGEDVVNDGENVVVNTNEDNSEE